ncbi:serine/threonine-protein kinase [Kutzneria buriramensis]|uniref:non-specific serine/threonine protein kinase n=1 Tax=Kutzneria buriramensis TaxID=1045776 RepID=A0A3E0HE50_9PSEU|nr:serine/threonine-protein kinase [Kutzneria buriramensis]REH43477.1 serine/threonine protein kinase [Kutzneria buriramensis]
MDGDPFDATSERPLLSHRYRIGALLGCGGMAEVYRAYDLRLERPVAIKRFTGTSNALDRRRFDDEARLLAGLSHPGLVVVYDAGQFRDSRYLVMRLVDGPTLHAALDRERLTVDRMAALAGRLLPTLAYVHARGIVHRDIKPSNILIGLDGEPYLADFGLARLIGGDSITRSGEIVGTAAYLAPEQVRGQPATPASDVYSLGLVLLQCLTGRQEYQGSQAEAALARLTRDPEIPDGLPGPVALLLADMTHKDPARRPSAVECAERFARLDAVELATIPLPQPRRRPMGAVLIGAVLAAGGAFALALWPVEPTAETTAPPPASTSTTSPPTTTTSTSTTTTPATVVVQPQDPTDQVPPSQVPPGQAKNNDHGPPPGKGKHH